MSVAAKTVFFLFLDRRLHTNSIEERFEESLSLRLRFPLSIVNGGPDWPLTEGV